MYPTLGSVSDAVVLVPSGRFVVGGGLAAVQEAGRRISGLATDPLAVARGSFTSGGSHRQELRGRIVEMPAYYIDKYEVTNRAYAEFVNATRRRPPHHWKRGAPVPGTEDHPVVNVSYVDAAAYAAWRGMRLPTEVEWERAAKGAGGALYPYGKEYNPLFANTEADGTRPVGSYEALLHRAGVQGLGLGHTASDMSGNVAEWTASVYDPFDYDIAIGGDGRYNPYLTKQRSEFRVVRGGSYGSSAVTATTVYRERMHEQDFNSHTGFRCVADKE